MMKRSLIIFFVITVLNTASFHPSAPGKQFQYLGVKKCTQQCHRSNAIGNQFGAWQSSPHARAYAILKEAKAVQIAKKMSIPEASSSARCLTCHTTAKGTIDRIKEDGVGCEACHGPGSSYHSASNHVDYIDRKGAYVRAIKHGMYPVLGLVDSHLKKREKLCRSCHNNGRPCYPTDNGNKYRVMLSIQAIDQMVKGDVDLRHPLRR